MIYFLALICVLLPSYLLRFSVFGIPTTLLEILIYLSAILTLVKILKLKPKNDYLGLDKIFLVPIILFLLSGIISIFISPDKTVALGLFKAYIFDPILFFFVLFCNIKKKEEIDIIFKSLIISAVLVSLHAIWQKLTGQLSPDGRVVGIFGYSPNYLALYLTPIAVLINGYETNLISEKLNDPSIFKKIWYYDFSFLIVAVAIWLTGSRAAIIAAVIGMAVFFVLKYIDWIKKNKVVQILLYCLVAATLVFGWIWIKPNWNATSDSGRVSSSNNIRWEIWKTTANDIIPKKWVLGVGIGNYQNYFSNLTKDKVNYSEWISPWALTTHNVFLNIWVNLGLLGLIAFVWLLVLFFWSSTKQLTAYGLLLIPVMFAIIIQGLVDTPYWKNDLSILFWILLLLSVKQSFFYGQPKK